MLVCAAGVGGDSLHTEDVSDEEWRRVHAINLDGVFYANRAAIPKMKANGYGRIVNVASIAGKEGNPMAGAYSSSKAAVIGLTKAIGKDVAGSGVLVNCIAPAVINTPILGQISEEHIAYMTSRIPLGADRGAGGGRGADLLARERGDDVLDRRVLRHLRRPGDVLIRFVRVRTTETGRASARLRDGETSRSSTTTTRSRRSPARARSSATAPLAGLELLAPIEAPEIWCAGVTYERSRDARLEEAETDARDVYALVYDADRPELFLKDARMRRTVGPGGTIRVRRDSRWNVPEPELGVVIGEGGEPVAMTIGNDVSSRDIEGANPLYIPQAKIFAGALRDRARRSPSPTTGTRRSRSGCASPARTARELFAGETSTAKMRRTPRELVGWADARQPCAGGLGAADRHRPRARRTTTRWCRATRSRSRSTASACSSTPSPR